MSLDGGILITAPHRTALDLAAEGRTNCWIGWLSAAGCIPLDCRQHSIAEPAVAAGRGLGRAYETA